jgi:DNA-binding transcriptional ArsR family regulator
MLSIANMINNLEKILKALANKRRLSIIKHLHSHKRASVGDLSEAIKLSFKSTSKHLGVLSGADIVDKVLVGPSALYSLSIPHNEFVKIILTKTL